MLGKGELGLAEGGGDRAVCKIESRKRRDPKWIESCFHGTFFGGLAENDRETNRCKAILRGNLFPKIGVISYYTASGGGKMGRKRGGILGW